MGNDYVVHVDNKYCMKNTFCKFLNNYSAKLHVAN